MHKAGDVVRVDGLMSKPELNGREARVLGYDEAKGRYGVQLVDGGTQLSLKPTNVVVVGLRMTARALTETRSEPSREHAVELVLLGHLLSARLIREGACAPESGFARVWRDSVVPIAASRRTEWLVGMCAEITGLTSAGGAPFNNAVARIVGLPPGSVKLAHSFQMFRC